MTIFKEPQNIYLETYEDIKDAVRVGFSWDEIRDVSFAPNFVLEDAYDKAIIEIEFEKRLVNTLIGKALYG